MARARKLLLGVVSCGYIGFIPYAPGTYASAAACLPLYLWPGVCTNPVVVALVAAAAILSFNRLDLPEKDPGYVVIDELAGMFLTMMGHPATAVNLLKGFILFRVFDILKPYPIRRVERLPRGYGVVADDLLAGLFANLALVVWGKIR